MALSNRIRCTTATTGTGALTLSATGVRDATNGDFLAPAEVGSELANDQVPYFLINGSRFASGMGSISADGLTLTRDPFEQSWNGTTYQTALLSLTGTTTVLITPRAEDLKASSIGVALALRSGFVAL